MIVYDKSHKGQVMSRYLASGAEVLGLIDDQFRNILPALEAGMRGIHCLLFADSDYHDADKKDSTEWIKKNGTGRLLQADSEQELVDALTNILV